MKPVTLIAILVFSAVAATHLLRVLLRIEVVIGDAVVPMWVSVVGFFVAGILAYGLSREGREDST